MQLSSDVHVLHLGRHGEHSLSGVFWKNSSGHDGLQVSGDDPPNCLKNFGMHLMHFVVLEQTSHLSRQLPQVAATAADAPGIKYLPDAHSVQVVAASVLSIKEHLRQPSEHWVQRPFLFLTKPSLQIWQLVPSAQVAQPEGHAVQALSEVKKKPISHLEHSVALKQVWQFREHFLHLTTSNSVIWK